MISNVSAVVIEQTSMTLQQIGRSLFNKLHISSWLAYNALTWPVRRLKASLIYMVDYMFNKTISTVQKLLVTWSIFVMLVVVSLMLYAAFYAAYVPTAEIIRPVHLTFRVCSSGVGICSFPSANITFWNDEGTVQEFLGSGQAYTVELILVMPDSHANRDLGMFMVAIKMYDRDGQISTMSQRSTMYKYRSVFMRVVDTILLSPLYFVGFMEQKKTLTVELFSHFVDDYYHPSVGATIEIHNHKIEVYSATVRLLAKLTGLKYFLHNWPLVSAVCAFWFNLFILAAGVTVILFQRELQRKADNKQIENDIVTEDTSEEFHQITQLEEFDDVNTRDYSTQTIPPSNEDNEDTCDLPLVQEPVDFPVAGVNEEIMTELRLRRVN